MSDHREPVTNVSIPSPSVANVPHINSEQDNECLDKENKVVTDTLVSHSPENSTSDSFKISSIKQQDSELPQNIVHHGLTSVVPILSQAPSTTPPLNVPNTSTLAHSVVSLLPKVISPPSPVACNTIVFKPVAMENCQLLSPAHGSVAPLKSVALPKDSLMPSLGNSVQLTIATTNSMDVNAISNAVPHNILKPNTANNLSTIRGTTSRPKIPINETIPDFIPEFLPGKIDAKRFPPRHFDFSFLEIGSWKYETKSKRFFTPATSRLKVIFSQRKFVYEFELRAASVSGMVPLFQKEKVMTCIEISFSSISGINISNCGEVLIEVNTPPSMYMGKQVLFSPSTGCAKPTKYDTSRSVDLTDGQVQTIPYHKIKLSTNNLRNRLESFDPRFDAMLRTPIAIDLSKRITVSTQVTVAQKKRLSDGDGQPAAKRPRKPSTTSITGEISCMCSSGCNTQRCSCLKNNGKCGAECKCIYCENPLSILVNNGVNLDQAKEDTCLMQNIMKIKDLDSFMKENKPRLPCCDIEMSMKDISIGSFECPECEDTEYRFSWCSKSLCEEEYRPRNHCSICKKCGDYRDEHCKNCDKCYFAGREGLFKCPCTDRQTFADHLCAFLGCLHSPDDESDNDYY